MRRLLPLLLLASLAACTLSLPGTAPETPATILPGAILPDAIAVTSLDAPLPATHPPTTPPTVQPALQPKPRPATLAEPAPEPAPRPATPASAEQRACLAKGGTWTARSGGLLHACIRPTRDSGKSCRKEGDCEGACLARSRTCAPVIPLFGCVPILQQDGSEATLCID